MGAQHLEPRSYVTGLNNYRRAILATWGRYAKHGTPAVLGMDRMPLFAAPPTASAPLDALFVGINPSFDRRLLEGHWRGCFGYEYPKHSDPFTWRQDLTKRELRRLSFELAQLDAYSRENYAKYYRLIEDLAGRTVTSGAWHVFDVFPIRASLQRDLALNSSGTRPLNPALLELLDAFVRLVADWRPRLVVVLNRGASNFLARMLPLHRLDAGVAYTCEHTPATRWLLSRMLLGRFGPIPSAQRHKLEADIQSSLL